MLADYESSVYADAVCVKRRYSKHEVFVISTGNEPVLTFLISMYFY